MSHDDLATDLAAYLRGTSKRLTWEDMQLGESGSPRPDVYTLEPTYTRLSFEAFECKVSVADFRGDVTKGKWQSYLRYANSMTFAVPAGLIDKKDVPPTCGLIVRSAAGVWRYAKKPVRTVLMDLPYQAWIKLLLDGVHREGDARKLRQFTEWSARRALGKKFGDEVAAMLADLQGLPERRKRDIERYEADRLAQSKRDAEERTLQQAQRERDRDRCSDAMGRLAVALGLPAEALLTDLQARASQLCGLLRAGEHNWRRHPFKEMAERLDALAQEIRSADAVLSGQAGVAN